MAASINEKPSRRNLYSTPLPFSQWGYSSPTPPERYSPNGTRHIEPVPLVEQRHQPHRRGGSQSDTSASSRMSGSLPYRSSSSHGLSSTTDNTSYQDSNSSDKGFDRRFPTGHGIEGVLNALAQPDSESGSIDEHQSSESSLRIRTPPKRASPPPNSVPPLPTKLPVIRDGVPHLMRLNSGVLVEEVEGVALKTTNNHHRNETNGRTIPEIEADDIRKIPNKLQKSETHPDRIRDYTARSPSPIRQNRDANSQPRQISPRPTYQPRTHVFVDRWASLPRPEAHRIPEQRPQTARSVHRSKGEGAPIGNSPVFHIRADDVESPDSFIASPMRSEQRSSPSSSSTQPMAGHKRAQSLPSEFSTPQSSNHDDEPEDEIDDMIPAFMKAKIENSARSLEENLPFNCKRKNNLNVTFRDEPEVKTMTPRVSTVYE